MNPIPWPIDPTIQVANYRNLSPSLPGVIDVRCDRSSPLGNPFVMRNETEREAVVKAHKVYLWTLWKEQGIPPDIRTYGAQKGLLTQHTWEPTMATHAYRVLQNLVNGFRQGNSYRLIDWCHPLPCHTDNIAALIQWACKP